MPPFNGSGTYSLPAGNPVTTNTTISSSTHNSTNSDIATALTTCIAKDGQTTPTANIPLGGFKLTGLGNGSAATDSVALGQLQAQTGVYVGTVGGTADVITLTASPAITAYAAGQTFSFIASGANTTNVTVNVSSLGAKAITKFGTTALVANNILSGSLVTIRYDGTQFQLINVGLISSVNNFTGLNTFSAGIGPAYLQNIGLTAAVSAKALTVALKTKALADASSTDPVQVSFRNATLTTGDYAVRSATAATSVVVPNGATLGFTTAQTGYLYVYALDNAGTIELAISASNGFNTATVQSTTAIGASSDSGSVLYSTSARTDVAVRYIGRIKIATGAVPGEWDNEDTEITLSDDFRGSSQGSAKVATATTNIWDGGDSCHIGGATVTMTIATPCVVTEPGHIRADQEPIKFSTTGALPTGFVAGTQYYVKTPTGSTYNVSATAGGAAINTSGTQSGTHTVLGAITSFGTAPYAGATKRVICDVVIPITHSANLNLPTAGDLTTAVGDFFTVYADTTTQLDVIDYDRASGQPLVVAGMTFLQASTANGLNRDLTAFDNTLYSHYLIIFDELIATAVSTTDLNLRFSTDGGSTFKSGAADYANSLGAATDTIEIFNGGPSTTQALFGKIELHGMASTDTSRHVASYEVFDAENVTIGSVKTGPYVGKSMANMAAAINAVRLYAVDGGGSSMSGNVFLYGYRRT